MTTVQIFFLGVGLAATGFGGAMWWIARQSDRVAYVMDNPGRVMGVHALFTLLFVGGLATAGISGTVWIVNQFSAS